MRQKVTMQQIADHLGVSKFVVSKALAGKKGVSLATRDRVIRLATQLGYFVNNARPAVQQDNAAPPADPAEPAKQNVIVLMPNIRSQTRDSSFWGTILEGILTALERQGFGMVIVTDNTVEQLVNALNPDGFMGLIGVGMINTQLLLAIHRLGMPIVLVDHEDPLIPADCLFINNYDAMARLTEYVIGLGHRAIRFVGDVTYSSSFRERWHGFRDRMEDRGLYPYPSQDCEPLPDIDAVRRSMKKAPPTALICANDDTARFVMEAVTELGFSIPRDVSITGFDNVPQPIGLLPSLTTVHVEKEYLGSRAVEMLLWRLEHKDSPAEHLHVSGSLLIRDSTSKPLADRAWG